MEDKPGVSPSDTSPNHTRKEVTWHISKMVVDSTDGRGKCTRRLAQTVRKNAKSLLNLAESVQYTAGSAFQSARLTAVKR